MVTIVVLDSKSGKPQSGVSVCIGFDGLRGMSNTERTNREGKASFDVPPGHGKVFLNGSKTYTGSLKKGETVVTR